MMNSSEIAPGNRIASRQVRRPVTGSIEIADSVMNR